MFRFVVVLAVTMLPFDPSATAGATDPCLRGPFKDITRTNELGEIIGPLDRGDWGCLGDTSQGGAPIATPDGVPVPPPTAVCLREAYPNPATTVTKIRFTLPQAMSATVVIYGRHGGGPRHVVAVRTLANGAYAAGSYEIAWDLTDDHGLRLSSGIYRAVLTVNGISLCGDIEIL